MSAANGRVSDLLKRYPADPGTPIVHGGNEAVLRRALALGLTGEMEWVPPQRPSTDRCAFADMTAGSASMLCHPDANDRCVVHGSSWWPNNPDPGTFREVGGALPGNAR